MKLKKNGVVKYLLATWAGWKQVVGIKSILFYFAGLACMVAFLTAYDISSDLIPQGYPVLEYAFLVLVAPAYYLFYRSAHSASELNQALNTLKSKWIMRCCVGLGVLGVIWLHLGLGVVMLLRFYND